MMQSAQGLQLTEKKLELIAMVRLNMVRDCGGRQTSFFQAHRA